MLTSISNWLDEVTTGGYVLYLKRLTANDTQANGSHQAGPYITKDFLFRVFPDVYKADVENPRVSFHLFVDSDTNYAEANVIWYNNRLRGGTRNEARITRLGGADSPLLDPENTGALTVFAFNTGDRGTAETCRVWISRHGTEEDIIEERFGPVEPGQYVIWDTNSNALIPAETQSACWLNRDQLPLEWLAKFPTAMEIVQKVVEFRRLPSVPIDERLLRRRDCEYDMFKSIEEHQVLSRIQRGFESVDEFTSFAQSVLQRRKARSGLSLELHAREIFIEVGLTEGTQFSYKPVSEGRKSPDFLFPSVDCYQDPKFPESQLRMLGVKTTCKDRWRQILNEADRIQHKHLLTLQEGVSETQFREMKDAKVVLVVPKSIFGHFPKQVRPNLVTLEDFIAEIRLLQH